MKLFLLLVTTCLPILVSGQIQEKIVPDTLPVKQESVIKVRGQNPPKLRSFIIPAALMGYGMFSLVNGAVRDLDYSTKAELQEHHPKYANHADDYLRIVPMVAVYGLNLAGVRGKHSVGNQTGLYVFSMAIMAGSTTIVKRLADRPRPDGADNYSFPSGHTAMAFTAAECLNQEYRDVSPWIGYAGYTVATATGVLRMYNNRHWLSDVVAGAGFGIASAKLAYLLYPKLGKLMPAKGKSHYSMVPTYQQKSFGLALNGTF
jgi:hypothetical protein